MSAHNNNRKRKFGASSTGEPTTTASFRSVAELAAEIKAERERKERLEWYLNEVIAEKELLMESMAHLPNHQTYAHPPQRQPPQTNHNNNTQLTFSPHSEYNNNHHPHINNNTFSNSQRAHTHHTPCQQQQPQHHHHQQDRGSFDWRYGSLVCHNNQISAATIPANPQLRASQQTVNEDFQSVRKKSRALSLFAHEPSEAANFCQQQLPQHYPAADAFDVNTQTQNQKSASSFFESNSVGSDLLEWTDSLLSFDDDCLNFFARVGGSSWDLDEKKKLEKTTEPELPKKDFHSATLVPSSSTTTNTQTLFSNGSVWGLESGSTWTNHKTYHCVY